MSQTSIQKQSAIRFGSGKLEMGASTAALTNIGAIRNLVFNSLKEDVQIDFDNTNPLKKFVKGTDFSVTVDIAELDMATFSLTDAGWAVVSTTAGTPVAGATQTLASGDWNYNNFYKIENQMGDGTSVTINSVTGGTDGVLTDGDGFHFGKDENGNYGIYMGGAASELTTESQAIVINYDYTPNASKDVTFNDFGTKTLKVARITNTDSDGNTFIIDMEDVTNTEPLVLPFLADDADDVAVISMTLTGTITSITDSQCTT